MQRADTQVETARQKNLLALRLTGACSQFAELTAIESASGAWSITYRDLALRSAMLLASLELRPGQVLVLYLPKDELYYVALAACFLNGIDVCPVDDNNPASRVAEIVSQISCPAVLASDAQAAERLAGAGLQDVRVPGASNASSSISGDDLWTDSAPPTYFIATSGSSGKPKIVKVPHTNVIAFLDWAIPFYEIDQATRWSGFSSIGFDLSLVDFLATLCGGGTLIALATRMERSRLQRTIETAGVTHWHSVPSVIAYIVAEAPAAASKLRVLTFCGEPLASSDVDQLVQRFPNARVINTYGPTEATLFCSYYEVETAAKRSFPTIPIGAPIPGWNFLFREAPGQFWRLIIESSNVAGYLDETSDRFKKFEAFGESHRLFDTGDYFTRVDGQVFFSHRRDGMVKVAGNRVDLGEIESRCKSVGLRNPVAYMKANRLEVAVEDDGDLTGDPRESLRRFLPNYAVPSRIRTVQAHPRTVSGKIDRAAVARNSDDG